MSVVITIYFEKTLGYFLAFEALCGAVYESRGEQYIAFLDTKICN
jgi:hypothetical protein